MKVHQLNYNVRVIALSLLVDRWIMSGGITPRKKDKSLVKQALTHNQIHSPIYSEN